MASYHNSPMKQENRNFKLEWAKRAIRYGSRIPREVLTLCGNSVWFETQIARFALAIGKHVSVFGFNINLKEFLRAKRTLRNTPGDLPITIVRECLTADELNNTSFVDFDTCKWFGQSVAYEASDFCAGAEMVAISVIIKGRVNTIKPLPEMSRRDMRNPAKIGEWLESMSPLSHLATHVYRNPGSASTMATIIMGKKSFAKSN